MVETKDVDRETLLAEISRAFFTYLKARMEGDVRRGREPAGTGKINVEIVLNGLELAKEFLVKHFKCREGFLYARAKPKEETTWATLSEEKHGWKMFEYLLDFSISVGPIPVAIGEWTNPNYEPDEKYELLLGAESEMNSDMAVTRDLLKLLDTRCRVKVLLYEARKDYDRAGPLKGKLESVFNLHASTPTDDIWLVLGVPNYAMWHEHRDDLKQMPNQVYTLVPSGEGCALDKRQHFWPF